MNSLAKYNLTVPINVKDYLRMSEELAVVIHNIKCYEEFFMNKYDFSEAHSLQKNRQLLINMHTTIIKTLDQVHNSILKEGVEKLKSEQK